MAEGTLGNKVLRLATKMGARLFRNNCGSWEWKPGKWLAYGLGNQVGGSDYIGWTPIVITEEMVGDTVAVFTAVETKVIETLKRAGKKDRERYEKQKRFVAGVQRAGGIAGIVLSERDLTELINEGVTRGRKN